MKHDLTLDLFYRFCQIRSSEDKVQTVYYRISGPGVDQDPVGLFYMERATGKLFVTKPLDREERNQYKVSNCATPIFFHGLGEHADRIYLLSQMYFHHSFVRDEFCLDTQKDEFESLEKYLLHSLRWKG